MTRSASTGANPWVLNSKGILFTRDGRASSHQTSHPPEFPVHLSAFPFENQDAFPPFAPPVGPGHLNPQRGIPTRESGRAVLTTSLGGASVAPPCADVPALLLLTGVIFISIWDYLSLSRRLQFFFSSCPSLAYCVWERRKDRVAKGAGSVCPPHTRARVLIPLERSGA